jgi:hypothetical protein
MFIIDLRGWVLGASGHFVGTFRTIFLTKGKIICLPFGG